MLPFRQIVSFFARLLAVYGLFVIAWPGIQGACTVVFCAGGNLVFRSLIPGGSVRFHPLPDTGDKLDTRIHLTNKRSQAMAKISAYSRRFAYLQSALLVSLVLATPLPWRRRLWTLLCGLILLNVVIACNMLIGLLRAFASRVGLLNLTPAWDKVLQVAYELAFINVASLWPLPVLVWILVSFRRADLVKWVHTATHPAVQRGIGQVGR